MIFVSLHRDSKEFKMLDISSFSPFQPLISFHKIVEMLEERKLVLAGFQGKYVADLLQEIQKYPELIQGIESMEEFQKYESVIKVLLADLFPMLLSNNEIKAVTIPYYFNILNLTQRFQRILEDAGPDYQISLRGLSDQNWFIFNCCLIIRTYFQHDIEMSDTPMYMDIPDKNNITKHYRVLINADFMEIIPTDKAKILSEEEIMELLNNYENLDLWLEKFPQNSWILKGFSIMNLYDATIENAVSQLKGNLLSDVDENKFGELTEIFRSIYKIPKLKIGITIFGNFLDRVNVKVIEQKFYSHLLNESTVEECESIFCDDMVRKMIMQKNYWVVPDVESFHPVDEKQRRLLEQLKTQNARSIIFVPLYDKDKLLGILELSSPRSRDFNSVNAHKMDYVLPFIQDKISTVLSELENEIEAIIQKEYTSIHKSVQWRFKEEAYKFLESRKYGQEYALKEIVFKDVYPLYGQIDVQGSSLSRNEAIQKDLVSQLEELIDVFHFLYNSAKLPLFEQRIFELKNHLEELKTIITSSTEQYLQNYLETEIHKVLMNFRNHSKNPQIQELIDSYFEKVGPLSGLFYKHRREFDESISLINKKLAAVLDEKQMEAQSFFPHYYERFKTDGVEHNIFIGSSIAPDREFNAYYLQNLRLWQMQIMCEMENHFRLLQPSLPQELQVSSLILVFGTPISIRFRMDEKQFDIDGSYNVRYQIAKKRIDKAKIKNTDERITQKGKLTIVYQTPEEEREYLGYIKLLQHKNMLDENIETFEIEDLQGIIGLKGLRVGFLYHPNSEIYSDYQNILATH